MKKENTLESIEGKMGFYPEIMGMIREMSPELFEFYKQCDKGLLTDGALPAKIKVLMALAVVASQRCDSCCVSQMRSALNHGATKEEIMDTLNVIFVTSGAPGVATCRQALKLLSGEEAHGGGCVPRKRK